MKIKIHRGTNQIGGCITEIQAGNDRIIIDLGSNLQGTPGQEFSPQEIYDSTKGAKAILYTHYHGDHVGLLSYAAFGVTQYIGEGALQVLMCKDKTLQNTSESLLKRGEVDLARKLDKEKELSLLNEMKTFNAEDTLTFGSITVTPYFCSHSAFDSYMFLIEHKGKKILHTGDFREHGYLGKGLKKILPLIGPVDALIMEGTMLGRSTENVPHEVEIKKDTMHLLLENKKRHHLFALCSSTDMDRLASLHAACKETHAWLICDKYQREILDIFTERAGKYSNLFQFDHVKVLGEDDRFFDEIRDFGFVMLIRPSMHKLMKKMLYYFPDAELIYSMWNGYYKGQPEHINKDVLDIIREFPKSRFHELHTSGHATIETLSDVIKLTNPRKAIIMIHREKDSDLSKLQITDEQRSKLVFEDESNKLEYSI